MDRTWRGEVGSSCHSVREYPHERVKRDKGVGAEQ